MRPTAAPVAPADPAGGLAHALALADPGRGAPPADALPAAEQAATLAAQQGRAAEEAQAQAWRAIHLHALGRFTQLLRDWRAVEDRLAAADLRQARAEFLRVVTLAASETGAHDVALEAAQRLIDVARGQDDAGLLLQANQCLAICFERMGDSWQAMRLMCQAIAEDSGASPPMMRLRAHNGVAAIGIGLGHRLRGIDDAEADQLLDQALSAARAAHALLDATSGAVQRVVVCGNLGEALLLRGDAEAAAPLVTEALALARNLGLQGYEGRLRVTWAALQWARGDAAAAGATLGALLTDPAQLVLPETQIRGHRLAYQVAKKAGQIDEALAHFECAEAVERRRTLVQMKAQSSLFVTRAETERARLLAEQARVEAQRQRDRAAALAHTAETDPLTGLGNRRHLQRRWAELARETAGGLPHLALALLDLDHFKRVNDEHGHDRGDRVLVQLAGLLRDHTRQRDVLVRHGGEEFLVLMPGLSLVQAHRVCERLRRAVAQARWVVDGAALSLTASIGLATGRIDQDAQLMRRADEALYRAKHAGRDRVVAADDEAVNGVDEDPEIGDGGADREGGEGGEGAVRGP